MKIKKITSQHRRDFIAIMECGHCGNEKKIRGYDDANYHNNVIPAMECAECGRAEGAQYRPLAPRYTENVQL